MCTDGAFQTSSYLSYFTRPRESSNNWKSPVFVLMVSCIPGNFQSLRKIPILTYFSQPLFEQHWTGPWLSKHFIISQHFRKGLLLFVWTFTCINCCFLIFSREYTYSLVHNYLRGWGNLLPSINLLHNVHSLNL